MTQEQQIAQDRLQIIEESISKARAQFKDTGKDYLFWGWLTVITCLVHFSLLQFTTTSYHWLPWPVIMTAGGIYMGITKARESKIKSATSHVELFMSWLWGISAIVFFSIAAISIINKTVPFAYILLIAGMSTLISGGVLKYRPLILGGIAFFVFAGICVFVSPLIQMLLFGIAIIFGYLVPGYMLRASSK